MTNAIIIKQTVNTNYYTAQEFADGVKLTRRSITNFIKNNKEFREKYCVLGGNLGSKKPRYFIAKEGLAAFIALREKFKGNQHKKKVAKLPFETAKMTVADKANEALSNRSIDINKMLQLSQNLLLAIGSVNSKLEQIEASTTERIEAVNKRLEKHEEELKKPLPVTDIHRQFLNDRVRLYCRTKGLQYALVWGHVNRHVGRGGVAFYNFQDFQKALKFVKAMYEEAGMDWE